jgi:hypothetical protein
MRNSSYSLLKAIKQAKKGEDSNTADSAVFAAGQGLLSKKLLDKSLESLLGAKKFYHGTSDAAAKAIRREGLDPSKGGNPFGSSNAINNEYYVRNSTGKVHIATNTLGKLFARMHSVLSQAVTKDDAGNIVRPVDKDVFDTIFKRGPGTVLKGYMPYENFVKNFEADPDHTPIFTHRSTEAVPAKSISGGGIFNNYKTLFKNRSANIPTYLKSNPERASKGLLFLLGSGYFGNKALGNAQELKKSLEKKSSAMQAGSFMPPEPLPNSIKAKQLEQQELAAQQAQEQPDGMDPQLAQMQKAQEDAVNQLQQSQQQLAQTQAELQNVQSQAQQQQQAAQMQAQQEIQKAQMDAQYELQSEKIKNQQKLLSVQEKYMRSAGKAKPDQNHILSSQLKRVVRKVNSIKSAGAPPIIDAATGKVIGSTANTALSTVTKAAPVAAKVVGSGMSKAIPYAGAAISGASALNNLSKGNYLSAGLDAVGGLASGILGPIGIPIALATAAGSSYFENPEKTQTPSGMRPTQAPQPAADSGLMSNLMQMAPSIMGMLGGGGQPAGGYAPRPQRWDTGLSPEQRFSVMNQAAVLGTAKYGSTNTAPDIRSFMKNPPPKGQYIASPIPLLQAGFKQNEFDTGITPQQGYGPIGNFIKQLIFNVGFPAIGMRNPLHPDFSKVYGSLANNEAYRFNAPNSF